MNGDLRPAAPDEFADLEALLRTAYAGEPRHLEPTPSVVTEALEAGATLVRRRWTLAVGATGVAAAAVAVALSAGQLLPGDPQSAEVLPGGSVLGARATSAATSGTSGRTTTPWLPVSPPTTEPRPKGFDLGPTNPRVVGLVNLLTIPASVLPTATQLGHGVVWGKPPLKPYPKVAVASGQYCDEAGIAALNGGRPVTAGHPVAGLSELGWSGTGEGIPGPDDRSVDITVTAWNDVDAAWQQVIANTGTCRVVDFTSDPVTGTLVAHPYTAWPGRGAAFVVTKLTPSVGGSQETAGAVTRVGNAIVAVSYSGPPGTAVTESRRLLDATAARVLAALPFAVAKG